MTNSPETPMSPTPRPGPEQAATTHAGSGAEPDVRAISTTEADETARIIDEPATGQATFDPDTAAEAAEIVRRYPQSRSALLPMLHLVQSVQGYVSQQGITFCAEQLDLSEAEVSAVVTFYSMYKRKPCGRYLVSVCTNTLCAALGGDEIYRTLGEHLGNGTPLSHEETAGTPGEAGSVTLEHAECLAACDLGPVLQVNYEYYDKQSPRSAVQLADALRSDDPPAPSRGAPVRGFTDIERQLAGFFPADAEFYAAQVDSPSRTDETVAGDALAEQRGWTAPALPDVPLPEVEPKEGR